LEGYFIGTFLMLDTPAGQPMFPYRPVEGHGQVKGSGQPNSHATVRMVLDGQQRITSLFYALYAPPIPVAYATVPYRFYLDLKLALNGDLDEAAVGISSHASKASRAEIERRVTEGTMLRFTDLADAWAFNRWLYGNQHPWSGEDQVRIASMVGRLNDFMIPVVALSADTGRQNVVNIFERLNSTGVRLTLFDLAVARLYLKGIDLRSAWQAFERENAEVAQVVQPEALFRVMALLQDREPRKANLLDVLDGLDDEAFSALWRMAVRGILLAHARTRKRYGAVTNTWIPYSTMLVPLAALLLGFEESHAAADSYEKLDGWYWASVLSQRYDSAVDTKSLTDFRDVLRWVRDDLVPDWIRRLDGAALNLDVNEPRSAVYRGLMCLVVRAGAHDFLTGQPVELSVAQDDHMFPRATYGMTHPVDLIANRTLISAATNQVKSNKKPSVFMEECLEGHGGNEGKLLSTLATHFISPEAHLALQLDDFEEFIRERRASLQQAVIGALPELPALAAPLEGAGAPVASPLPSQPNVWLVRAGGEGAEEPLALREGRAVIGWGTLGDITGVGTREALEAAFVAVYGDNNMNSVRNQVGQVWAFLRRIQPGDLVVLPRKASRTVAIGRVVGPYEYRGDFPEPARHTRPVEWLITDLPRDAFDQQVLNSLGAFMTVCKIDRNGADDRIREAVGAHGLQTDVTGVEEVSTS
jgi:hypothetical protein